MDESLSFDFETGLETSPNQPTPTTQQPTDHLNTTNHHQNNSNNVVINVNSSSGGGTGRRSYRQTVCRHWLRGLCMKGDGCGFLHQYDKSRMPVCRFFRLYGECREQDCVYKHTNEDVKECHMYKLGFCPNGPDCRYKHAKLPGPPPPVQDVLRKIQQLTSHNYGNSNRFFHNRNANHSQGPNNANQVSRPTTTDSVTIQPPPHRQHVTQYQQG
nr:30-kDa cleavage and polyadenylation specificity factor 30-like [Tanacetum cinerariifolium]